MSANFILTKDLPVVTLSATAAFVGTGAEFNLPVLQISSTFFVGRDFSAAFNLPVSQLEATALPGNALVLSAALPLVQLDAQLLAQTIFSAGFALPRVFLTGQILSGNAFTAGFSLPPLSLASALAQDGSFAAVFNLSVSQLDAALLEALQAAFRTWVLNTRKAALSEYDFEFNSYAFFNGLVLAASSGGIVVLGTQGQDNTTAIDAAVRVGKSDYATSYLKRVPRLYVGIEADGDLLFRTITSESGTRTYRLPHNHVVGHQQRRVPIGKGPKSRYWQYEIANEGGADFSVQDILAYPTGVRRRSQ